MCVFLAHLLLTLYFGFVVWKLTVNTFGPVVCVARLLEKQVEKVENTGS